MIGFVGTRAARPHVSDLIPALLQYGEGNKCRNKNDDGVCDLLTQKMNIILTNSGIYRQSWENSRILCKFFQKNVRYKIFSENFGKKVDYLLYICVLK